MGGNKPDPTYKEVCTGTTNHAEMVEVIFDPEIISYQRLLAEFWVMHDPTSLNQQGGDIGTQYRSSIFTTSPEQMQQALASKEIYQNELTKNGMDQIVTQILPASGITYWLAEDYHQRYLEKNPNGYDCHSSTGVAFPTALASNNG
jgi:peptide-methionine (S)-S-oxide reductase